MHAVGVELPAMCVTESLLIQNVAEHFFKRRLNTKQNAPHKFSSHFRLRAKVKQGVECGVNARRFPWSRRTARRGSWRGKCTRRPPRRGRCSPTRCAPAEIRAESVDADARTLAGSTTQGCSHGLDDSGTSSTSATICSTAEPQNHGHGITSTRTTKQKNT